MTEDDRPEDFIENEKAHARAVRAAQTGDAGLVVIATQGHGGLKKLVLGSVAQQGLQRLDRDILVVPAPQETGQSA